MNVDLPSAFQALLRPKRFKVFYGGRGAAKTVSFSKALLLRASQKKTRVLCLREFMSSIKESVHSSLSREIEELKLQNYLRAYENEIRGCGNDSLFIYRGINRNPSAIKSYDDFNIAWLEEAESFTDKSLKKYIIPTVRAAGSEIWISFNPNDEFDAVYIYFVKPHLDEIRSKGFYEDELLYVARVNLPDNPFAPQELIEDSARMKKENPRAWEHIYGGECYADYEGSIIKPEWFDAAVDAHVKLGFKPLGGKVTSFDPADTGDDKALIGRHGSVVKRAKRWGYGELPDAIDIAFEKAAEWQSTELIYDDDGLGKSMKVYIKNTNVGERFIISPFNGNATIDNPDDIYNPDDPTHLQVSNKNKFKNKRAQYYWYLADRFEAVYNAVKKGIYSDPDKMISICPDIEDIDVLKSELVKIKRVRGNNIRIQIQSKKDMLKDGFKSPNMADSLMMCFANPPRSPEIEDLIFDSEF